jgi:hypothetical protein
MFKKIYKLLLAIRDSRQLATKIKTHTKQDSLIYPWYNDPKN